VTGAFANVTSDFAFLNPSLSYTSSSVILTLQGKSFLGAAGTANQRSVAGALDASPFDSALVQAVLPLSTAGAQQAFDALSGEIFGSLRETLIDGSFLLRTELLGRLRQAAYAGSPGVLGALSFGGPDTAAGEETALAYRPIPVKAVPVAPAASRDLTFWAHGLGGWARADGDGNAAAVTSNVAGFIGGVDARFGAARLGVAGGYSHASVNAEARTSAAGIDSAHVGAYAGTSIGPLDLRTGATYSFHTIDTTRNIMFPGFFDRTLAHFDGGTAQVFGEVGHALALGWLAVEPFAGLAWVQLQTNGFLENGGLAALSVGGTANNVGYSALGLRAATAITLDNGTVLVPRSTLAWQHAFDGLTPAAAVTLQSTGAAFTVAGLPIAREAALLEGGFDLRFTPSARIGVTYSGALANHVQTHAVKGGFTWKF
jgi:uncharacterized protein with beta-barrel porin domain